MNFLELVDKIYEGEVVNVYSKQAREKYEIYDETFDNREEAMAKKKELKAQGFDVKMKKISFSDIDSVTWEITGKKLKKQERIVKEEKEDLGSLKKYPETADFLMYSFGTRTYFDKARELMTKNKDFLNILKLREKLASLLKENKIKEKKHATKTLIKINKSIEVILDEKSELSKPELNSLIERFYDVIDEEVNKIIKGE